MRNVSIWIFCLLAAASAAAQPNATGPVADLNAEAKTYSDTDPGRSMAAAQKALVAARRAKDIRGEAEAQNYVAYGYRAQSLLDLARTAGLESVRLYAQLRDGWGEAQGYNTLGLIEADAGQFADALGYHLKALAIRQKSGDKEGLAYTFNNLGNTYRNMGAFDKALEFHQQGLALKIELGLKSSEAFSHHNIGLVHFATKDYAAAEAAYRRGMAIREQLNDPRGMAVSLNAIGQVQALTDRAAALRTYEQALALRRSTGDQRGEMATELNLGELHRRSGNYAQAAAAYTRALALGERLDAPLMHASALKGLADLDAARGDYASAYKHHLEFHQAREKIFNDENTERFQRLRLAHEAERQQQQIGALERENALRSAELSRARTTRTALTAVAVLVLISLGLVYARLRLKNESEARFRTQAAALADALDRVKTLRGLLPICAWCKNIRDDNGYWTQVESYLKRNSDAEFTHCICPACFDKVASQPPAAAPGA